MRNNTGKLKGYYIPALIALPLIAAFVSLCVGRYQLPVSRVAAVIYNAVLGSNTDVLAYSTVINTRLPRILLAAVAGAGLSVAGCAFQSLFTNPLATPDTLGVASGASFGAALGILLGFSQFGIQSTSFLFGAAAVVLTFLAGKNARNSLSAMVLSGIMIGSLFSSLISLVKFAADTEQQLPAITYWLMGSLSGIGYKSLAFGSIPVIVGIAVLLALRYRINLLVLSSDEATATGVNIKALRIAVAVCATVITAACVSMCGQVGWIGLLVPHMCRMMFGNNHLSLLPACVSVGTTFLIVTDTLARSLTPAEIPISVLTAIIGAPFFILLMNKSRGWQL